MNPHSVHGLAKAISSVLHSRKLRRQLIREGYKRVGEYDWQEVANRARGIFHEAATGKKLSVKSWAALANSLREEAPS